MGDANELQRFGSIGKSQMRQAQTVCENLCKLHVLMCRCERGAARSEIHQIPAERIGDAHTSPSPTCAACSWGPEPERHLCNVGRATRVLLQTRLSVATGDWGIPWQWACVVFGAHKMRGHDSSFLLQGIDFSVRVWGHAFRYFALDIFVDLICCTIHFPCCSPLCTWRSSIWPWLLAPVTGPLCLC